MGMDTAYVPYNYAQNSVTQQLTLRRGKTLSLVTTDKMATHHVNVDIQIQVGASKE